MEKQKIKMKKKKKKVNALNVWATVVSIVTVLGLLAVVIGLVVIILLLKNKPTLNIKDFDAPESSVVYSADGQEIGNLGATIRENISYEQLPNVVVDAFIGVEDSRFFEHPGFDVPRFAKAMLENLKTLSFGQGGSTFTMQLCKNTYFVDDETGEQASRSGVSGIRRKVQEIALAMELEHIKSKKSILSDYINILNYGGSGNIRGIQKASQYYFQKDVEELNISEAALLAGVINAPNMYNPFNNLEAATERRDEVLYLMNYHGYISDTEYELAKSIKVEDILMDPYKANGDAIPYQAYIDAVVDEVYNITGLSPYSTTMHIYTYMIPEIQETMDNIQAGLIDEDSKDYFEFPDEWYEIASICIDNDTGEIVGILGGRNYADGGALLLNHATDQYKQPGSSIKPIIDYSLAFENLGWSTSHVLTDKPIFYGHEDIPVENFSNTYVGDVTLTTAVGDSINTTAIQTLQKVIEAKGKAGEEYVVDYLQSIGYDVDLETFDIQFAIGGAELEATPKQMASAYTMIMNGGKYIEPHCVSRIEFANGKTPVIPTYESSQVLSEAACYLTSTLLRSNVQNFGGSYYYLKNDYPVYAKTGTTDWAGDDGKPYGIPSGANKDAWIIACTSDYSTATWTGYERATAEHKSYIDSTTYNSRVQAKIADIILDKTVELGSKPKELNKPEGVSSITHILGTYPYAQVIDGMDPKFIATGLVKTGATKLVSPVPADVEKLEDNKEVTKMVANVSTDELIINWAKYPNEEKLKVAEETYKYELKKAGETIITAELKRLFDYSWIYGPVQYKADITIKHANGETVTKTVATNKEEYTLNTDIYPGDKIEANLYYGYENVKVNSNSVNRKLDIDNKFVIKLQNQFTTANDCETWMNKYIGGVSFTTVKTSDAGKIGTYVLKDITADTVYSPTGNSIELDATHEFVCEYYIKEDKSISITNSTASPILVDQEFILSISASADVDTSKTPSWTLNGLTIASDQSEMGNNQIKVYGTSAGDYSVKATWDGASDTVTITIQ